jgi:iron complex outermembrane receptor protein
MRGSNPTINNPSRRFLSGTLATIVLGALPLAGGPVLAQGLEIEEIIVTAQRREQAIEDVPLSVTTMSGERFNALFEGGEDVRALATRIPSLYAESSNGRLAPRWYMRGLGNTDFDLAASQQVSVLFDEIVQENVILKSFPIFDIERVEVLRGPQGSLFGRNTPAGIVKFDTRRPTESFDAYGQATVGTYSTVNLEGGVGGALNDNGTLMGRFSFLSQNRDDWISNGFTGQNDVMGGFNELAWRAQLLAEPSDDLSVLLSLHGRDYDGTASIFRGNALDTFSNAFNENYIRDQVFFDEGDNNPQEAEAYGGLLRLELGFDNGATLTSITGFETVENRSQGDIDGGNLVGDPGLTAFPPAHSADGLIDHAQFTQEIRLSTEDADGNFWQAGFFYFESDFTIDTNPFFVDPSQVKHTNDAWALFAQGGLTLSDTLMLTVGLRLTDDDKEAMAFNEPGAPVDPVSVSGQQTSWDASLMWDANESINLYLRVANGFRAPSIQGRDVAFFGGMSTAKAEEILSTEIGFKFSSFDNRVLINGAVFHYAIDDMQLTAIGGAGNFVQLVNADEGRGMGMDIDASIVFTDNFIMTAGLSFVDTEIRDNSLAVPPCGSGLCSPFDPPDGNGNVLINGNPFPGAPDSTFNVTARYSVPTDSGELFIFTDYASQGKTNFFLYESAEYFSEDNWEWGVRAGYIHGDNDWEVSVFGRNITDEENLKGGIDFNNNTAFDNEPRIWGITFRKNWGS